jgi:integrase
MDCSYDSERGRMTRPRLYQRCKAIGRRAGIEDVHPHRFRDTFAVDMLARGATPYDVANFSVTRSRPSRNTMPVWSKFSSCPLPHA